MGETLQRQAVRVTVQELQRIGYRGWKCTRFGDETPRGPYGELIGREDMAVKNGFSNPTKEQ